MATEPVPLDRRQRRRLETIEEVLDVAIEVMAEQGVAGLSVGEVARRMGIRPPSLYVYFPSKHALYDALFERGARLLVTQVRTKTADLASRDASMEEILLDAARVFVRWTIEHPAYSQLLFWRPVPGFEPSPSAYAPATELVTLSSERFAAMRDRGLLRTDVSLDVVQRDWTVLIAGVVSQQLANAPDEDFERGRFVAALPAMVAMFARYYGAGPTSVPRRRATRERSRRSDR
ncbi:MAG TPA: TetR/AcrR family transcriptional regulator [Mycobacteriales bacterium]|jgi:AcrR family transcriptional regulator|nr:TetR/AcrR family transcriptional regulator [Mycobacteriales bacterium]